MHEDIVECVHASGNNHLGASGNKLHESKVDRTHGTGACRVHNTVCASEIKTVADSSGHHIPQEARERVLLP